jgi:hypothetical protein
MGKFAVGFEYSNDLEIVALGDALEESADMAVDKSNNADSQGWGWWCSGD